MAIQMTRLFTQDINKPVEIRQGGDIVFNDDNLSNIVSVALYDGTSEATPVGTVVGAVVCSDGSTVPVTNGSISGNVVSITLTEACFAIPGRIGVGIQLVSGDTQTTVLKAVYNVEIFTTSNVIDPSSHISLAVGDLIDDIATATASIPASYTDLMAAVAPTFSSSVAYTAGQYVWYDGDLYKFTADHAAGAWTGSDAVAAVVTDDLSDLKSAVDDMNTLTVDAFPLTIGHMLDTGKWGQLAAGSYKHFVYPVSAGDVVRFTCTVKNTVVGFVTDYALPLTSSTSVLYSAETGFTSKITIVKDTEYSWITPSDAKYIIVEKRFGSADVGISVFEVNGFDHVATLNEQIVELQTEEEPYALTWESGAINSTTGEDATSTYRIRTNLTSFDCGVKVTVPSDMEAYLVEYHSDGTIYYKPLALQTADFVAFPTEAGAKFRLFGGYTDHRTNILPSDGLKFNVRKPDIPADAPMWYALGDSLVQGYYSVDNTGVAGRTYNNYPAYAALANRWRLVNYGVGGAGYLHVSETWSLNGKQVVDAVDFSNCDICTLAFGVNDWHYNQEIGTVSDEKTLGTTMASNMKYCIEKILTDNPLCRLNIMLPMNCSAYGGDFDSDWGLGTTLTTSGTLQHVVDVIKAIAEMYHLPIIDQIETGIANRYNILSVLPDGIHPSTAAMKPYGERIASQIL